MKFVFTLTTRLDSIRDTYWRCPHVYTIVHCAVSFLFFFFWHFLHAIRPLQLSHHIRKAFFLFLFSCFVVLISRFMYLIVCKNTLGFISVFFFLYIYFFHCTFFFVIILMFFFALRLLLSASCIIVQLYFFLVRHWESHIILYLHSPISVRSDFCRGIASCRYTGTSRSAGI